MNSDLLFRCSVPWYWDLNSKPFDLNNTQRVARIARLAYIKWDHVNDGQLTVSNRTREIGDMHVFEHSATATDI